jgi:hypothetical protein
MTLFARLAFAVMAITLLASGATACDVAFDCAHGRATINGKTSPIVCARSTGHGMSGGELGHVFAANGRWRPGLVAPGTPMISTSPQLCDDCHVHAVSDFSFSNGCLGVTGVAFRALRSCAGSKFSITPK